MIYRVNIVETPKDASVYQFNTKYINCTRHALLDYISYKGLDNPIDYIIQPISFPNLTPNLDSELNILFANQSKIELNGATINKVNITNVEELFQICKESIMAGKPVLLWLDWFYMQGLRLYNKVHLDSHNALVIGIDTDNKSLCVSDRWKTENGNFAEGTLWIPISTFNEIIEYSEYGIILQTFEIKSREQMKLGTMLIADRIKDMSEKYFGRINIERELQLASILRKMSDMDILTRQKAKQIGVEILTYFVANRYLCSYLMKDSIKDQRIRDILECTAISWWKIVSILWSSNPELYEVSEMIKCLAYNDENLILY